MTRSTLCSVRVSGGVFYGRPSPLSTCYLDLDPRVEHGLTAYSCCTGTCVILLVSCNMLNFGTVRARAFAYALTVTCQKFRSASDSSSGVGTLPAASESEMDLPEVTTSSKRPALMMVPPGV